MLDIRDIRADPERVTDAVTARGDSFDIDALLRLDTEQRDAQHAFEELRARQNALSKEIGTAKAQKQDASALMAEVAELPEQVHALDKQARDLGRQVHELLLQVPNIPHESVPSGQTPDNNMEIRTWGKKPAFDFTPKWHDELGEALGILDFERAAKVAGARFVLMRGLGARLEHALTQFMLTMHTTKHNYTEVLPPFLVTSEAMTGTGNLPKFGDDAFKTTTGDHYLVPTAEVPVTNLHRDEMLNEAELPLKYVAYTPCFRSEAGSYGQDTRGMIRLHQFNKVELVKFTTPESSYDEHESLTRDAEAVLQALGLHYRVMNLCPGEFSFSAAKCYDLEVWLPGQGAYREISSCSNFEAFQARRANIRYRPAGDGKKARPRFVHTLNGSGLAVGRTIVALLEQYQQQDGSVVVPEVLRDYMGTDRIT